MTTHCEPGISGCLPVWCGCWGNHYRLFHDMYLLEHLTLTKQSHNKVADAQTKLEYMYEHSISHIMIYIPTSGSGRGQKSDIISNVRKMIMVLGRAHQPHQIRQMDIKSHHLETIWQEHTTRDTSQAVKRRPGQILE